MKEVKLPREGRFQKMKNARISLLFFSCRLFSFFRATPGNSAKLANANTKNGDIWVNKAHDLP
jgi:hypothetical protein